MEQQQRLRPRAAVVVLGDFGRSPRMQYHTLSLAEQAGYSVDVVAYRGSDPAQAIITHPHIKLHLVPPPITDRLPRLLRTLCIPIKLCTQVLYLLYFLLLRIPRPDILLVQNPPTIPTFSVAQLVCALRKCRLVIDWHNFGYTLLGMQWGSQHGLVKFAQRYEKRLGQRAHAHLCVTHGMQSELARNWNICAEVLYDKPPSIFHRATLQEKHELFLRLHKSIAAGYGTKDCFTRPMEMQSLDVDEETFLTTATVQPDGAKAVTLKRDRPAVIVSSTSWTADEDFDLLLETAVMYDQRVAMGLGEVQGIERSPSHHEEMHLHMKDESSTLPKLLILITGKGPLRAEFESKLKRLRLRRVAFRTLWVSAEEYPLLLGSADLGVSLHSSSSGLDLPMKVVDMFGCGLPVCAFNYQCIGELVRDHQNGLLFSSSMGLLSCFMNLLRGFSYGNSQLDKLRNNVLNSGMARWEDEWAQKAMPLFQTQ